MRERKTQSLIYRRRRRGRRHTIEPDCHNILSASSDINNTACGIPSNHIPPYTAMTSTSQHRFRSSLSANCRGTKKMERREETWGRSEWSGECRGQSSGSQISLKYRAIPPGHGHFYPQGIGFIGTITSATYHAGTSRLRMF